MRTILTFILTLALWGCGTNSGGGQPVAPDVAADAATDAASDALTDGAAPDAAPDAVALDSATDAQVADVSDAQPDVPDVPDVPVNCGSATPEECKKCGAPPEGKLLCHGCPYYDPPPECYAVCSATICYECVSFGAAGAQWGLVNYDCFKPGTEDVAADASSADTADAAVPADTAVGGQAGDQCGDPDQAPCAGSLVCCYPCGIPGCHNTCTQPCVKGPGCTDGGCMLLP